MDPSPMKPPMQPVCSLEPASRADRLAEIGRLAEQALLGGERDGSRLRLRLRSTPEVDAAVRDLVRREQECCAFLHFEVSNGPETIVVEITAPSGAEAMLDQLEGALATMG